MFLIDDTELGYGMYMAAALELFGKIQNNLLDQAREISLTTPELQFLKAQTKEKLAIQKAAEKDLISSNFSLEKIIMQNVVCSFDIGKSSKITYCFRKISV